MPDGSTSDTDDALAVEVLSHVVEPDGLPMSAAKEGFSLGFVRMVAAASRCSVKSHDADYDGVDITIVSSAEYQIHYGPQFELQVKCTSQIHRLNDEYMSWRLDDRAFTKLTHPKRYLDAYLGVLVVPPSPDGWLDQNESRLLTQSRMYWQRADKLGTIDSDATGKTVRLPRSNLFSVRQLLDIMRDIGGRGDW